VVAVPAFPTGDGGEHELRGADLWGRVVCGGGRLVCLGA
jgi:hypothetical protein